VRSCLEEMEQARLGEADRELEDDRAAEDKDRAARGRCGAEQAPAASASAQLADVNCPQCGMKMVRA